MMIRTHSFMIRRSFKICTSQLSVHQILVGSVRYLGCLEGQKYLISMRMILLVSKIQLHSSMTSVSTALLPCCSSSGNDPQRYTNRIPNAAPFSQPLTSLQLDIISRNRTCGGEPRTCNTGTRISGFYRFTGRSRCTGCYVSLL